MCMRQQGKGTRYPGVYRVNNDTHRIRAVGIDPRTGRKKQVEKLVNGVSAQEAARLRAELAEEIRAPVVLAQRQRVGDFARSWIRSKALGVDATTASTYADALEHHVLPVFGNHFYDAVTKADVQRWVDDCLELRAADGKEPRYSRNTVHGWFRTFRTMTRDAVDTLELTRDPTLRIRFPPAAWLQDLMARRIGIETMDTAAACRTYNILAQGGRSVAAALLLE